MGALPLFLVAISSQAQDKFIAYVVPTNTVGNQSFGGSLGMDFNVNNPVIITQLGVFDDQSDGLKLPITARLYDRSDPSNPVEMTSMDFTPDDPGTLIGGSRFKPLPTSIRLEVGAQCTIVAEGYGDTERLRNTLGDIANINWTTQDGNGSLQFVGTSRFGNAGEYPATPDEGPAARYAAGTFEFQTTPPLKPGTPAGVVISASDGAIQLTWQAVTNPLPAAKYQIYRALTLDGTSNQVAEITVTQYEEKGLTNGQIYFYYLRSVGANGSASDFVRISAAPYVLATNLNVAYFVPPGVKGSQAFDGVLGMDFLVINPIIVTRLGVYDDGTDGLFRTITARLFDRTDPNNPVEMTSLEFSPEDPGAIIGGSHFKDLAQPIRLESGFQGTITAENYGAEEKLFNSGGNTNQIFWTTNDGEGSIMFVGTSRFGAVQATFPGTPDGGPAARYAAGSFIYQTTTFQVPGVTVLSAIRLDRGVKLTWTPVVRPLPAATYRVFKITADGQTNQVADVPDTQYSESGLTLGAQLTYFVRAVAANGKEGLDSNTASVIVEAVEAGIAYQVAAGSVGSQAFGGALGMDFDVVKPIKITRLGVFDDGSDGLTLTITAHLYDRAGKNELAKLEFTPDNQGELIGGSRFKDLAQPLVLGPGFQGTIATSGYGVGEQDGNGIDGRSVFSAADTIRFVGTGRWGTDPNAFPATPDGGPFNRYAAGTFYFVPLGEQPKLTVKLEVGKLTITWTGSGTLEKASKIGGPWDPVSGASSGYQESPSGTSTFYRVKM